MTSSGMIVIILVNLDSEMALMCFISLIIKGCCEALVSGILLASAKANL